MLRGFGGARPAFDWLAHGAWAASLPSLEREQPLGDAGGDPLNQSLPLLGVEQVAAHAEHIPQRAQARQGAPEAYPQRGCPGGLTDLQARSGQQRQSQEQGGDFLGGGLGGVWLASGASPLARRSTLSSW